MKKYCSGYAMMAMCLLSLPLLAAEIRPDKLVDDTASDVLAIVRQDKDLRAGNTSKILDLVEAKVLPHFDFTRMTRLAMGKHWGKAGPDQQERLVKEFRTLLVRTYSNALTTYRDETIRVEPLRGNESGEDVTVKTLVIQGRGQQPVPIDYSMHKTQEGWKVYDVTVAGVSLVTNYRSTFNSQVRDGGVDKLIDTLAEKNRRLIAGDQKASSE
jgi:phospholipid transport system substrate-binding protein